MLRFQRLLRRITAAAPVGILVVAVVEGRMAAALRMPLADIRVAALPTLAAESISEAHRISAPGIRVAEYGRRRILQPRARQAAPLTSVVLGKLRDILQARVQSRGIHRVLPPVDDTHRRRG